MSHSLSHKYTHTFLSPRLHCPCADGEVTRESGTSASSPVFGAMVTLWNDMRLGKLRNITSTLIYTPFASFYPVSVHNLCRTN